MHHASKLELTLEDIKWAIVADKKSKIKQDVSDMNNPKPTHPYF
jgi:hypothetical protein